MSILPLHSAENSHYKIQFFVRFLHPSFTTHNIPQSTQFNLQLNSNRQSSTHPLSIINTSTMSELTDNQARGHKANLANPSK